MDARKRRVTVFLTEKEYEKLYTQSQASGIGMSAYLRNLILERQVRQRDITGYSELLQELSNMDAVVFKAAEQAKAEGISQDKVDQIISLLDNIWNTVKRSL
ncbi:hypothetical protein LJC42_08140 [Eubacteriales bacterium OttesenSCG-928-K08]|nr:hypothetical protein [Eubacteriales bacterium OttesenSCG-928-K08]